MDLVLTAARSFDGVQCWNGLSNGLGGMAPGCRTSLGVPDDDRGVVETWINDVAPVEVEQRDGLR